MKEIKIEGSAVADFVDNMKNNLPNGWSFLGMKNDETHSVSSDAKFYYFGLAGTDLRFDFVFNRSENLLQLTNITHTETKEIISSKENDALVDKIYNEVIAPLHRSENIEIHIIQQGEQ